MWPNDRSHAREASEVEEDGKAASFLSTMPVTAQQETADQLLTTFAKRMAEFGVVLASIRKIRPVRSPRSERELEELTVARLRESGLAPERQKHVKVGRLDIIVVRGARIVIEMKRLATINCLEQLDRYSKTADGLLVVCWRATAPFKETFRTAPRKIPTALVELKQQAPMIP